MWQAIIRTNGNVLAHLATVNNEDVVAVLNKQYENEECTFFKTKRLARRAATKYNPNIVFLYRYIQKKEVACV